MKIGRLIVGRRKWRTSDFKLFYSPMPKQEKQLTGLSVFWWFGHRTYVVIRKRTSPGGPDLPYRDYVRHNSYSWRKR